MRKHLAVVIFLCLGLTGYSDWQRTVNTPDTQTAGAFNLQIGAEANYVQTGSGNDNCEDLLGMFRFGLLDNWDVEGKTGVVRFEPDRGNTEIENTDIFIDTKYRIVDDKPYLPAVALMGGVKVPATDLDSHLGTGETDFRLYALVSKRAGSAAIAGHVGYVFMGDSDDVDYANEILMGIEGIYWLRETLNFNLWLDGRRNAVEETEMWAGAGAKARAGNMFQMFCRFEFGLNEDTTDWDVRVGVDCLVF